MASKKSKGKGKSAVASSTKEDLSDRESSCVARRVRGRPDIASPQPICQLSAPSAPAHSETSSSICISTAVTARSRRKDHMVNQHGTSCSRLKKRAQAKAVVAQEPAGAGESGADTVSCRVLTFTNEQPQVRRQALYQRLQHD